MKKLLSIIASASILVSAPLAAVACGKRDNSNGSEFDYEATLSEMLSSLKESFQIGMSKELNPYFFTDESKIDFLDYVNFENIFKLVVNANAPVIINHGTDEFNNIKNDLSQLVGWDNVLGNVKNDIVNNVNYRKLLVDGANPLQTRFDFDYITITKTSDDIVSINFRISSVAVYKNKMGQNEYETLNYNSSISIFQEKDVAEELNKLTLKMSENLASPEHANHFVLESDSGNITKNIGELEKSNYLNGFNSLFEAAVESDISLKRFTLDMSLAKLDSSLAMTAYSSPQEITYYDKHVVPGTENHVGVGTMFEYWNQPDKFDTFTSKWVLPYTEEKTGTPRKVLTPYVLSKIKADSNSSWALNHYALKESIEKFVFPTLSKSIEGNSSQFSISEENDNKTIAVYGTNISGMQVTFTNQMGVRITLDLPKNFFLIKQNTKQIDTNTLLRKWYNAAFEVQANFVWKVDGYQRLFQAFDAPQSIGAGQMIVNKSYNTEEVFEAVFDEYYIKSANADWKNYVSDWAILVNNENSENGTSAMSRFIKPSHSTTPRSNVKFYDWNTGLEVNPTIRMNFFSQGKYNSGLGNLVFDFGYNKTNFKFNSSPLYREWSFY
ncbi:hypothetical protein SSABA_v1c01820 [Spiroplasma sabaudiense Ar-1343]|uniref:Lipoprotein n=1 Tax=Spiroplasma sabaudiense Ar-1343 TaxID=1276257 RepID=W6AIR2_9MOLU|nr:hypothetical protein [Spiroplasma sabaudiense]AHI53594.1 hypothetical protein SSABA_v1c01820 [Spiroplasma sabaudiense Ar-1343]